jgi:uncharacterized protein (TIGR03435 family)
MKLAAHNRQVLPYRPSRRCAAAIGCFVFLLLPMSRGASAHTAAAPPAFEAGLTLAQALQLNFDLKLEAKKNPAAILMVDPAEKVSTEN